MKALTVRQPYAQLIVLGPKTIETRSWSTKHRCPLVIHAGAAESFGQGSVVGEWQLYRGDRQDRPMARRTRMHKTDGTLSVVLPLGAIVGTCNLVDVVPMVVSGEEGAIRTLDVDDNGSLWIVEPQSDESVEAGEHPEWREVTDQLPYGDFTPGRFAWLLEDIKPVEQRCPACWGSGNGPNLSWSSQMADLYEVCPVCTGSKGCDPISAKGKQGLWNWEP
jgi:hypothetical protein